MSAGNVRQGAAYNTITHFVLMPLFTLSFAAAIYLTASHRHDNPVVYPWLIVLSFALILLNMQSRLYTLRLQDRIIRLEEQMRIASLAAADQAPALQKLTTSQLIGLRFASDSELPALAIQASQEGLTTAQIKENVVHWRRDDARV